MTRFIVVREDRAVMDLKAGLVKFFDTLAEAVEYASRQNAAAST